MSVHITGMEMPSSCESCPCKTADAFGGLGCQATGYIPLRKANQDRPDWCPLVPVPEHGWLIDADARVNVQIYNDEFEDYQTVNMSINDLLDSSWIELEGDPTIIPADKEGEG